MGRRVLITGLGTFWGGRVAQALEKDPEVDVIVGLDTVEPGADAAANRFIVPITLISWMRPDRMPVESTTRKVWMIVSTLVAATMRLRIE